MFEMITLKLSIAVVGLWAMTRLLGKKEISQLNAFDFVSSLMLSELVGNTIYDQEAKVIHLLYALALWTGLSIGLEKITVWFPRLGRFTSGKPELLIHNRKVIYAALRRNNLDFDQLNAMLRQSGAFALSQVEYAVLETNGSLSVMLKADVQDESREDMTPPTAEVVLPVSLIVNGRIDEPRLRELGKDGGWLAGEMRSKGVEDIKKVLYAEWSEKEGLYVQLKA